MAAGAVVLASVALVMAAFLFARAQNTTNEIRDGQIESCEKVGAVIQDAIIQQYREAIQTTKQEIQQSKAISPELFPDIPLKVFHQLQRQQNTDRRDLNHERRARIAKMKALPSCQERFST